MYLYTCKLSTVSTHVSNEQHTKTKRHTANKKVVKMKRQNYINIRVTRPTYAPVIRARHTRPRESHHYLSSYDSIILHLLFAFWVDFSSQRSVQVRDWYKYLHALVSRGIQQLFCFNICLLRKEISDKRVVADYLQWPSCFSIHIVRREFLCYHTLVLSFFF